MPALPLPLGIPISCFFLSPVSPYQFQATCLLRQGTLGKERVTRIGMLSSQRKELLGSHI